LRKDTAPKSTTTNSQESKPNTHIRKIFKVKQCRKINRNKIICKFFAKKIKEKKDQEKVG